MEYHINPKTGKVGLCRATKSCPFGGDDAHYSSKEEAQQAYEDSMVSSSDKSKLSNLLPVELLEQMVVDGYINVNPHPEDPQLKILCYTPATQYSGMWNEATKIARGLIIRDPDANFATAEVVARPWRKFYTLEQHESGWSLGDEEEGAPSLETEITKLDFEASAEVLDKVDGSLGILYRAPDGLPAFSTKGSFSSDQAAYYTNLLRDNEALLSSAEEMLAEDSTYLFELIGPENRIVCNYANDDIVLLGSVNRKTGEYYSPLKDAQKWGGSVTEVMEAKNIREAFALPTRDNREGFVIRILSKDPEKQMQIKMKQEDYKIAARVISSLESNKLVREALYEDKSTMGDILEVARTNDPMKIRALDVLLSSYDAHNHPVIDEAKKRRIQDITNVVVPRAKKLAAAQQFVSDLPQSFLEQDNPAKAFAFLIQDERTMAKSDLFSLFQARLKGAKLDELPARQIIGDISKSL